MPKCPRRLWRMRMHWRCVDTRSWLLTSTTHLHDSVVSRERHGVATYYLYVRLDGVWLQASLGFNLYIAFPVQQISFEPICFRATYRQPSRLTFDNGGAVCWLLNTSFCTSCF